jgi:DUF971 family protein
MSKHLPTNIVLHQKSHRLEISFEDGSSFMLPCEYLRVYSPSAAVRGHGPGQEVLQLDKEGVNIIAIEPVGNYAVKIFYDDGHNTGLYDWDLLYTLGKHHDELWQDYLRKLKEAGHSHSQLQD